MRTFLQKQKQPQKPASSRLVQANLAPPRQEQREHPFLPLPRTIGNQAVQRMVQSDAEERKAGLNNMASPLVGHDFSRIPIHPPPATPKAIIQRKPGDVDKSKNKASPKEGDKKAELEFHSTIAFNGTKGGSSSTGPAEEGFAFLGMQWTVWNSGWETAPEHTDRVTVYNADRCSGCRDEKDEIMRMEVSAPATVPITQPGEGEFKYEATSPLIGSTIRAGHYDVYVDLDVYDEVEEINEDNNTIFTTFYVKPRNKPEPDTEEE